MPKVPEFETLEDEVAFWEGHIAAKFWDDLEEVEFEIELRKNILHPRLLVLAHLPNEGELGADHLEPITIEYVTQLIID